MKFQSKLMALQKDKVEALGKSFEKKCEEMKNDFNSFTTEILKRASSTEAKVKKLENRCRTRFDGASKLIDSFTTTCRMKEELQMKFYAKGAVREDVTFDHIILPIGIKQRLEETCESQKELDHSEKKMKGYILYGPPGTGKTMIAKAIANETRGQSAFISASASDLSSKSNINKLFDKAKENTPCIIFIDEIDSVGRSRKLVNEKDNTGPLTHLLTKLDGFSSTMTGVTVVAATNHIDNLDEALIRHGRLPEHIEIPRLNRKTREDIIRDHLGSILTYPHHRLKVAEGTEGFSPANLLGLIKKIRDLNEAKKLNKNKIGEVCEEYKKTHNIGKSSDDKHGDRQKVGNKHRSSGDKSFGAGSQQSQRSTSTSRPISTCTSSEQKPFSTSTPVTLQKKRKEVPSQELAGTYISPISNSTETGIINDSNSNELYQDISKSPSQQKPIKKNKRRSSQKENKENSWQQDQKSPNTSINSTSTLPLKMQQITASIRVKNDIAHILY
ncbi:MAG: ATP-binding protein [Rickettsiales bacterium]|jgi:AAA+ superfamily predicted ATPase|nr:ATP-binding protein [Rickettsiales bacterium]